MYNIEFLEGSLVSQNNCDMLNSIITIIIPAYNAEKTIEKCLASICNQTYSCLEIVVVDDGSTDSTHQLVAQRATKDPRIVLISQANKGAAAARNFGLDNAHGDYYTFVDADDYIEPEAYSSMLAAAVNSNADIVCASIKEIYNGDREELRLYDSDTGPMSGIEAIESMLLYQGIRTVVWDKLYRRKQLGMIRFQNNYVYGEDTLFCFEAFLRTTLVQRVPYVGYIYDHRYSNVTVRGYTHESLSNIWGIKFMEKALTEEVFPERDRLRLEHALKEYSLSIHRQLFQGILLSGKYDHELKEDYLLIRQSAKQLPFVFIRNHLTKAEQIQWLLYLYQPKLFVLFHFINHLRYQEGDMKKL